MCILPALQWYEFAAIASTPFCYHGARELRATIHVRRKIKLEMLQRLAAPEIEIARLRANEENITRQSTTTAVRLQQAEELYKAAQELGRKIEQMDRSKSAAAEIGRQQTAPFPKIVTKCEAATKGVNCTCGRCVYLRELGNSQKPAPEPRFIPPHIKALSGPVRKEKCKRWIPSSDCYCVRCTRVRMEHGKRTRQEQELLMADLDYRTVATLETANIFSTPPAIIGQPPFTDLSEMHSWRDQGNDEHIQ
jgi:hypothetical protein